MSMLARMVSAAQRRLEETKQKITPDVLEQRIAALGAPRGFRAGLAGDSVAIIAEIKRASPLKGPLNVDLNAGELAKAYASGGAEAISVLTEPDFFQGSMEDLQSAAGAGLPLLRKDFIVDSFQLLESRAAGADAVLLIVRVVGEALEGLLAAAGALGLDALVEVYDQMDLAVATDAGAQVIGINHRDLDTFEVDPERTAELAGGVAGGTIVVSLSGVQTRSQVEALAAAGAHAVLVGESIVTAPDPEAKLGELTGVPCSPAGVAARQQRA